MMERDKNFHRILLKREIPELSGNLEDQIMSKVRKVKNKNPLSRSSLYLAWIFFVLSLFSGVIISTKWVIDNNFLFGLNFLDEGLIIQIFCSCMILLLFERLYKLSLR
jgi:hypothetical protein